MLTDDLKLKIDAATLEVYSTTWCPDCTRLRSFLAKHGIRYTEVDINHTDGAAERLEAETGKRGVPYLLVNGKHWVRGYHREHPSRFDASLLLSELSQQL